MTRLVAVSHTGLFSGAESVLERMLLAARDQGVEVLCCVAAGPFAHRLQAQEIATASIPELKLPGGPLPVALLRLLVRAVRAAGVLRRAVRSADVLVVNGLLGLPAVRLARLSGLGTPVAWLVHDIVRRPEWRWLLQSVASGVDIAVAVSAASAGPVAAAGIPVRTIWNGTRWPVEPAPPPLAAGGVVGCVGLLTPWKGQHVLLEAVAGLPGVRLELAGGVFPKDAPYQQQLQERASQPDLIGRVSFLGAVDDVPALLRSWAVFVSPSVEPDPGPLVLIEAMSVGLPVVATAHGGPLEYVGEAGLLVPPDDPRALRDALARLLRSPAERAVMASAGRRQVLERHQLGQQVGELVETVLAVRRR